MVRTELYFGMSRAGGNPVTEGEWEEFMAKEVTPRFPSGLTVVSVRGQWRDSSGTVAKEPSKVLVIFHESLKTDNDKFEAIRSAYKKQFGQESVTRATSPARVSF